MLKKAYIGMALALFSFSSYAIDNEAFDKVEAQRAQGYSVISITHIYGQLLAHNLPQGFVPVFEKDKGAFYIQEFVLKGETVKNWSQMITIAGSKGLSSNPSITPEKFASIEAIGFKSACPKTFATASLGERKIDEYDAYVTIMGCGESPATGKQTSEMNLTITIKGESDYYSIQWAERGLPSSSPIVIDKNLWASRMDKFFPIKLCAVVLGEPKPYPSCTSKIK